MAMVRHHQDVPETTPRRAMFPIRLIALDIDGTLVGDDLEVGPRTRTAIRAALAQDVFVSLVTGRMVSSAMRFARELGLTAPVVGYQGGLIREMPTAGSKRLGKLLFHMPLPADVARDIVIWTSVNGLDPHVNHLERFILRTNDPNAGDYSAFMGAQAEFVDDLRAIGHPVTKVLAVGTPPLPVDVAPAARAQFEGRADVTISHPMFLEFVAPGVSKGRAIRFLARRMGVSLEATLAIGDQWNDLEMLAEVGHGAAMATAPDGVKAVARYVAPPVSDEGVATMIESLVLASPREVRDASERLAHEATVARTAAEIRGGASAEKA